ncbi:pectate lyase [Xylanibacter caecicola]|uniref:pectate lyase n=1 Tax=Xylanibacter caecicola TaxID=2736294 RepID=UPI00258AC7F2|nr:pectate lyase [Xylanibacter caecicola]
MKRTISAFITAVVLSTTAVAQTAQAPAFPGAEGHGRYVTGGRGGVVKHVTNLNDNGPGSFRTAVSGNTKKIVVFDVAGVIPLSSDLTIGANTTIMGQTAPYPGITLRYRTLRCNNNIIVRFIRIRRGEEKDVNDGADAIWERNKTGMIFDHCSFSWCIDEVASFYDNNNFTMQWCTIAESLTNAGHGKGAHGYGGIWGGKLASFHHNMIAHVTNRGPRFNGARYGWTGYTSNKLYSTYKWANPVQAENVDFRNCVMYNAQGTCYGGPGGGQINMVKNYYKAGPSGNGNQERVTLVTVSTSGNSDKNHPEYYDMTSRYYISGNTTETTAGKKTSNRDWSGVSYDKGVFTINGERYSKDVKNFYGDNVAHVANSSGDMCVRIKMDEPAPTGEVTTHSTDNAYTKVLEYCGASLYRDEVDARYMEEAKTGTAKYKGSVTGKWGLIDVVADVNGYNENTFAKGERPAGFDTDNDGIPDEWEIANGLNPNDASDATKITLDPKGWYTNIEVYCNSIVEDIMKGGNADAESAVDEYYPVLQTTGIGNATMTSEVSKIEYYTLDGRKLEQPAQGISIRKMTLVNGKTITDKVIRKR